MEATEVSAAETPLKPAETGLLLTETPQSKVNYSIVKESIVITPKGGQHKVQSTEKEKSEARVQVTELPFPEEG